jgi:hypothetical protein
MGLDMYLSARKYVSDYNFEQGKNAMQLNSILESVGLDRSQLSEDSPSVTVSVNVAYWRKANHIHNWFIENVAGGEDDCEPFFVSRDDLTELHKTLLKVIAMKGDTAESVDPTTEETIEELLPTQSGFFFGGTEYDEWYWENTEWTEKRLATILDEPAFADFEFEYRASW